MPGSVGLAAGHRSRPGRCPSACAAPRAAVVPPCRPDRSPAGSRRSHRAAVARSRRPRGTSAQAMPSRRCVTVHRKACSSKRTMGTHLQALQVGFILDLASAQFRQQLAKVLPVAQLFVQAAQQAQHIDVLRGDTAQVLEGRQRLFELVVGELQFRLGQAHRDIGRRHGLMGQADIAVATVVRALQLRSARRGQVVQQRRLGTVGKTHQAFLRAAPVAFGHLQQAAGHGLLGHAVSHASVASRARPAADAAVRTSSRMPKYIATNSAAQRLAAAGPGSSRPCSCRTTAVHSRCPGSVPRRCRRRRARTARL